MAKSRHDALRQLHESAHYSLCMGHGDEWPAARERVSALTLDAAAWRTLEELDRDALDHALSAAAGELFVTEDDGRPLDHWWWHLGAIRANTYPFELLPASLRSLLTEQRDL